LKNNQKLISNLNAELLVSPNPANETIKILNLYFPLIEFNYKIYNASFQLVISSKLKPTENSIDIHSLVNGIYIIEFTDNSGNIKRAKFVKI
jgi:hypothetical protein